MSLTWVPDGGSSGGGRSLLVSRLLFDEVRRYREKGREGGFQVLWNERWFGWTTEGCGRERGF